MSRRRVLASFLAAVVLVWGAFWLPHSLVEAPAGPTIALHESVVSDSASDEWLEEFEFDDSLAPEAPTALYVAKSDHHEPVDHLKTALAFEPDAPVPLMPGDTARVSPGADAPRASEVDRVQAS